jgi:hypothetical protein
LKNRKEKYQNRLRELVNAEYEYRRVYQKKQMMLTDIFKNMEHLLINVDKAVI